MVVRLREDTVINPRELAVDAKDAGRLDTGVCRGFGVKDPPVGVGDEFVALEERGWCWCRGFGREEEEDVVGGYGEVDYDFAF